MKWIGYPVAALAVLEIVWNLIGAIGFTSNLLWMVKLAIFGYAGYVCTSGEDE